MSESAGGTGCTPASAGASFAQAPVGEFAEIRRATAALTTAFAFAITGDAAALFDRHTQTNARSVAGSAETRAATVLEGLRRTSPRATRGSATLLAGDLLLRRRVAVTRGNQDGPALAGG